MLKISYKTLTVLAISSMIILITFFKINRENKVNVGTLPNIAHAGGGYNQLTYTDSIEALNHNLDKFELFELDFVFTSDGHLVCLHDWDDSVTRTFGKKFNEKVPTISEFKQFVSENKNYKNCTFADIALWLHTNQDKKIVTDIKEPDNLLGLTYIAANFPQYSNRIIPQIYYPEQYEIVKNIGFQNIIWTLYLYPGSNEQVLNRLKNLSLFAITMPTDRAQTGFAKELDRIGVPSYVHTINDMDKFKYYKGLGIDGIYTDWLVE